MNARKSKQQCHIDEMKVLAPDFVLNVGDLIEGYNDNWKAVENEGKPRKNSAKWKVLSALSTIHFLFGAKPLCSEWNYILGQQ